MANEAALRLQGQQLPQQNQQEEEEKKRSTRDAIDGARNAVGKARNTAGNVKKIYDTAQKAKAAAQAAQAAVAALNPWVLAIILAIVGIILIYVFFFSGNTSVNDSDSDSTSPSSTNGGGTIPAISIPGLTLTLSGPTSVNNGEDIEYTVSYTYDATIGKVPVENIILFDKIPDNSRFVSTDGVQSKDSTPTVVAWSLEEPSNQKPFKIVLHPAADDTYINNVISAKLAAGIGTGSATGDPPEFLALVVGQGRNTAVLGDRATFISTIISNSSGLPLTGKEAYLGQIYDAGIQYNVNPLIVASIWGTESGFDPSATYPFGCLNPSDAGFNENVTCAAGSLNQLMGTFETHNAGGSLEIVSSIGNTCIYTDAFVYAYEMYAPICHVNDHNDPARGNFTSFYKKFKGI